VFGVGTCWKYGESLGLSSADSLIHPSLETFIDLQYNKIKWLTKEPGVDKAKNIYRILEGKVT
jgi:hypothetical protein